MFRNKSLGFCIGISVMMSVAVGGALAHGGGGGGGSSAFVESAETLDPHATSIEARWTYTHFKDVPGLVTPGHHGPDETHDASEAPQAAFHGDESFDALTSSLLQTVTITHGVASRVEGSLSFGAYRGEALMEVTPLATGGFQTEPLGDVTGRTDARLAAKYRVLQGLRSVTLYGGVDIPTGNSDLRGGEGDHIARLEPSSQPSTGAFNVMGGVAYSWWWTPRLLFGASADYTRRMSHDGYRVGDGVKGGVSLRFASSADHEQYPRVELIGESIFQRVGKDREEGEENDNTGRRALFVSGGVELVLTQHLSLTSALQVPVYQVVNGDQQETGASVVFGVRLLPLH